MNTKLISAAAGVIHAAEQRSTVPVSIAIALDAAGLLQSPESAAELAALRARVAELEDAQERLADAMQRGQHWRGERLVSERTLTQREIRALTGIPLRVSTEEEYRYCGADLGRTEFPFTCYRRVAHKGPCSDRPDSEPAPVMGPGQQRLAERTMAELEATFWKRIGVAPPANIWEDPHDSPLHHTYRLGHDLPPVTARTDCPLGGRHLPGVPCDERCGEKAAALATLFGPDAPEMPRG